MVSTTLAQKLNIRAGNIVALLNAPKGAADLLKPLPDEVEVVTSAKDKVDVILSFVKSRDELEKSGKALKSILDGNTILWFAYPKKKGRTASDLTQDQGWQIIYDLGYEGIASIAIDETWSGLRFRRRLATIENDLVAKQYAGDNADFLPIYQQLVRMTRSLGPDVEVAVSQAYVAFSRGTQFAVIQPMKNRLDLVLKLVNAPLSTRLATATGFGTMSHRVALTNMDDLDPEVIRWLQAAYRASGR